MRLLAVVTALALAVVGVIGAYAHAAGHASPAAEHAAVAADAAPHAGHGGWLSKPVPSGAGHVGHATDCDATGQSAIDCCDSICHGGQAILAASVLVPHPSLYAPLIQSVSAFDGAEPGGLERPPKPFRPA